MTGRIKYPIGIQTFSEIISEGYLYIDKTQLIHDLVDSNKYVFLSRPRRFGKSLLMSTLESYFMGIRDIFKGLAMEKLEVDWNSYPVFRFDLSGENFDNPDKLKDYINGYLDRIENRYSLHIEGSIAQRFLKLIYEVNKITGQKIVILIDEYDKPILDCLHNPKLHGILSEELRGFYSVIKVSDQYIRFAMLTGITRFSKVSVFSGLNNLEDISMLPRYNAICGISETEFHQYFSESISVFSQEHNVTEDEAWMEFKTMYDGYHFASRGEYIYNPFSVLNAFKRNELGSYWYASGSPSYLVRMIETNRFRLDRLEGTRRSEMQLIDISDLNTDLASLLYQSGYLTIKGYDKETQEYLLGFPNREVYKAFWETLATRFFRGIAGDQVFNVRDCVKDINEGKVDEFMKMLKGLFAGISSEPERNKEIHFQNMMAIACKMMGLFVQTEVHSAAGRCDMQILTDRFVYIFEFKIDGTPEEALSQIHNNSYLLPFLADTRVKILVGANFLIKTRTLDRWIIESIE